MYTGTRTMPALLTQRASERPDATIVTFDEGPVAYGALDEQATRIANALAQLGLERGDRVAVQLPNCAEYLAVWFGIMRGGFVEVPLNTGVRGALYGHALNQCQVRVLVTTAEWAGRIEGVDCPTLEHVVVVGQDSWSQLLAGATTPMAVEPDPYEVSVLLLTSGTTGPSKAVALTHNSHFHAAETNIEILEYSDDEKLFSAFPLFHINAKYTSVLPAMVMDRGELVLHSRFSASRFWDICREHEITGFNFMGALLLMLSKQPERADDADNPVRMGWGAPAPAAVVPGFEARFGVTLVETYGTTELGICTANRKAERRLGSCGTPVAGFEVQLQDERGVEVPRGELGEICVRPTRPHIMIEEYWGMPEATAQAFRGLWLHTGDRGRQDADGWFSFVDRMKDAIRRRGENISSWEVEQVLSDHPAVEEAAVIGVPSELTEEEVLAVVVAREGFDPVALLDHAQEQLPHFAVPRYVHVVDALPKNEQQRVQKFVLREQGLDAVAWDREAVGYVVAR